MGKRRRFKLHWKDGSTSIIEGIDLQLAFKRHGFGYGEVYSLQRWEEIYA